MKNRKKLYSALGGIYAGLNFLLLLIFYIPVYVIGVETSDWYDAWYYSLTLVTGFFEFLMPVPFAVILYFTSRGEKIGVLATRALCFALPKIAYTLPYYYLYSLSYGYDSLEGLLISLGVTLGAVIIADLHVILLYFVIGFASRRIAAAKMRATLPHSYEKKPLGLVEAEFQSEIEHDLEGCIKKRGVFDISSPFIGAIFAAAGVEFVYSLATEIASTVSYLVEFAGDYRFDEIIYIVICFILILIELFAAHAVGYLAKIFITEKYKQTEEKEMD